MFGKKPTNVDEPTDGALERIRQTALNHSELGFRIYKTFNGYRVMVTNQMMGPDSEEAHRLLAEFKSDPLYVRMCKQQQCFRARLTPKPWRCNSRNPPARFPFASDTEEESYRRWESEYLSAVGGYKTCELVATVGPNAIHTSFEGLVATHDSLTKSDSVAPLA